MYSGVAAATDPTGKALRPGRWPSQSQVGDGHGREICEGGTDKPQSNVVREDQKNDCYRRETRRQYQCTSSISIKGTKRPDEQHREAHCNGECRDEDPTDIARWQLRTAPGYDGDYFPSVYSCVNLPPSRMRG
jgi:hypothetical protein